MGLAKIKAIKKADVMDFAADLSAYFDSDSPVLVRFRRPKAPDYFPTATLRKDLLIAFPEMAQADALLQSYILIMGACYLPDDDDPPGTEPWRGLAQMGRDNPDALLDLIGQFQAAFPAALGEVKADAKND